MGAEKGRSGVIIGKNNKVSRGKGEDGMLSFLGCSDQAIAVANGVTTLALLEHLVERKILTRADVRSILESGIKCLEPRTNVRTISEAVHLMRDRMLPLFAEETAQH